MIRIGMDPNLFTIGTLSLSWHGLMTGLAVVAAIILLVKLSKGSEIAIESVYSAALWAILGGIVGARLVHVIDNWSLYNNNLLQILRFWEGGLSLYGAIYGGFLVGAAYCLLRKLPVGRLADLAIPGVVLAQAIGRIGCLINGDSYGTITSLPWGVVYTNSKAAATTILGEPARHPFPAYEIIWDLIIFAVLMRLRKRLKKDWMLFLLYAPMYSIERFLLSFLRGDEAAVLGGLHQSQVISLVIMAVTIPLFILLARRRTPEPAEAATAIEDSMASETEPRSEPADES